MTLQFTNEPNQRRILNNSDLIKHATSPSHDKSSITNVEIHVDTRPRGWATGLCVKQWVTQQLCIEKVQGRSVAFASHLQIICSTNPGQNYQTDQKQVQLLLNNFRYSFAVSR